ncbi:Hypothetical predicted protein [Pelobates cultripes]|uniref:Uncharacterized protein n=1 Tax=Pelobates cultripes TaxID=61616 RepID=A0AAD1S8R0_PELCU|nr:Hypothetical predicted protein [Pelobates cultripes]
MVSGPLLPKITQCSIGDIVCSDHAPLTQTLRGPFPLRGQAPWRLNNSLLHDPTFLTQMTQNLEQYFQLNDLPETSPIKPSIRGLLISRASYMKHTANHKHIKLLHTLRDVTNAHTVQPEDTHLKTIVNVTKRINDIPLAKTSYTLQRLKMRHYSQGNMAGETTSTIQNTLPTFGF